MLVRGVRDKARAPIKALLRNFSSSVMGRQEILNLDEHCFSRAVIQSELPYCFT